MNEIAPTLQQFYLPCDDRKLFDCLNATDPKLLGHKSPRFITLYSILDHAGLNLSYPKVEKIKCIVEIGQEIMKIIFESIDRFEQAFLDLKRFIEKMQKRLDEYFEEIISNEQSIQLQLII